MARTKLEKSNFHFEKALAELDKLVEKLEHGELTLEESLQNFEHGVALTRACQAALKTAEQKVQMLIKNNDKMNLIPFDDEAST